MPLILDHIDSKTVSLEERQALIKALPCFAMLMVNEAQTLADLMSEEQYAAGQAIVVEGELVDRVYIIVSGLAEVTHQVIVKKRLNKKKLTQAPLASIGPGDAIGLNETGFFSATGKRTASVTGITDVRVLALDLKQLHLFLEQHPHIQSAMHAAAKQMLRVRLIKQSLPFVRLSYERTLWLASQVEEVTVPAGTVIFKQGDIGDRCYLIRAGRVEIIATEEDGSERRLAVLKSPTLFGEATMITRAPRNATARALEDCDLFVLEHKHLFELIESENNVANMFMTLMVDRSRPLQNSHVTEHHRQTIEGQDIVILKNPDNGHYFKLSEQGWFIWQQLNGKQTMQAITLRLSDKYDVFAPDVVAALISKLATAGFVTQVGVDDETIKSSQSVWVRRFSKIRELLEARYAFGDADKWLTKMYHKAAYLLFTRIGKLIMSLLAMTGLVIFIFSTSSTIETFKIMPDVWVLILLLIPFTLLSVALHELGHAFATKSFGCEVHYIGVGWFWLGPVAFTDTSDMWLRARGPRIAVNLAGILTDVLVAGICGIFIVIISNPYIQAFLWLFALFTYINAFRMLSPLQELDGYYILMDLVDKPHLRQAAVTWLVKKFPKSLLNPSLFRKNLPEIYYWLVCLVFLILVSIVTLLVQTFVFKILGLHTHNPYMSLSLPFLVAFVSSLGIIADIRKQ